MASTYTLTLNSRANAGSETVKRWDLDVTSYDATTNIDLTVAELGLKKLNDLRVVAEENNDYDLIWNGSLTAPELVAYVKSTGAEVANATDLGVFRLEAVGR